MRKSIERQRCFAQTLQITAGYVIEGIRDIVESSRKVGQWSTALKGYELLGKHLKLFTDKTEVTGTDGSAVKIILHGGKNNGE